MIEEEIIEEGSFREFSGDYVENLKFNDCVFN